MQRRNGRQVPVGLNVHEFFPLKMPSPPLALSTALSIPPSLSFFCPLSISLSFFSAVFLLVACHTCQHLKPSLLPLRDVNGGFLRCDAHRDPDENPSSKTIHSACTSHALLKTEKWRERKGKNYTFYKYPPSLRPSSPTSGTPSARAERGWRGRLHRRQQPTQLPPRRGSSGCPRNAPWRARGTPGLHVWRGAGPEAAVARVSEDAEQAALQPVSEQRQQQEEQGELHRLAKPWNPARG